MSLYTLVQLFEVLLFAVVLLFGLLSAQPSLAMVGGGLLVGKAVLNILAPEGGTVLRRSVIGYGVGALVTALGIAAIKLLK
ncbi:MAG TPA: hypothetical protein VG015_08905 [Candidatus Dormibacteraeota bacterium]|nr:hypothetical protein [Candidatus Dormibacteraeota bacterium]